MNTRSLDRRTFFKWTAAGTILPSTLAHSASAEAGENDARPLRVRF
ncbi:hypothetical protein [Kiritimatiella glycovorans]|nr:hypothetical protein [Kiritimatiella glycovorans]